MANILKKIAHTIWPPPLSHAVETMPPPPVKEGERERERENVEPSRHGGREGHRIWRRCTAVWREPIGWASSSHARRGEGGAHFSEPLPTRIWESLPCARWRRREGEGGRHTRPEATAAAARLCRGGEGKEQAGTTDLREGWWLQPTVVLHC
jgi:hypothetical protein